MRFLTRLLALLALVSLATQPAAAAISSYSTTPASNTTVDGTSATNVAEGNPPGTINDAIRQIMADLASNYSASGIKFTGNAGISQAPSSWAASYRAYQAYAASLAGNSAGTVALLGVNTYFDGTNYKAIATGGGAALTLTTGGEFLFSQLASASAGGTQTQTAGWRMDGSGHFLGNTATTSPGSTNASILFSGSTAGIIYLYRASGSTDQMRFHVAGAQVGSIATTGSATSFNTSSDERLKENIADAADAGAIIDAIHVRSFDWRSGAGHVDYGFVAQELAPVVPLAVTPGDDGEEITDQWAVDYSKLVPLLVKEVQSLRARVAVLEAGN